MGVLDFGMRRFENGRHLLQVGCTQTFEVTTVKDSFRDKVRRVYGRGACLVVDADDHVWRKHLPCTGA